MREWSTDPRTTACNGRSSRFNGTAKLRLSMRQGWQLSKRVNCPQKIRLAIISPRPVVPNGIGTDMSASVRQSAPRDLRLTPTGLRYPRCSQYNHMDNESSLHRILSLDGPGPHPGAARAGVLPEWDYLSNTLQKPAKSPHPNCYTGNRSNLQARGQDLKPPSRWLFQLYTQPPKRPLTPIAGRI
jgi:hypothetical protein